MPRKPKTPEGALEALRLAAKTVYCSSFKAVALTDLQRLPAFASVKLDQLRKWSHDDGWVESRERNFAAFRRAMEHRAREQWVRSGRHQMRDCAEIRRMSTDMLRNNRLQPRSWEQVAKVRMEAVRLEAELVSQFGSSLMPSTTEDRNALPLPPEAAELASQKLSHEEAMDAAHHLLARRRERALAARSGQQVIDAVTVDVNPDKPSETPE